MHDELAMGVVERGGDLAGDVQRQVGRHDAVGELEAPARERDAGRVAHHHDAIPRREAQFGPRRLVGDIDVLHGVERERSGDVGVGETRCESELPAQPLRFLGVVLEEGVEGLDGDIHSGNGVVCEVDDTESSPAEFAPELVLVDAAKGRLAGMARPTCSHRRHRGERIGIVVRREDGGSVHSENSSWMLQILQGKAGEGDRPVVSQNFHRKYRSRAYPENVSKSSSASSWRRSYLPSSTKLRWRKMNRNQNRKKQSSFCMFISNCFVNWCL